MWYGVRLCDFKRSATSQPLVRLQFAILKLAMSWHSRMAFRAKGPGSRAGTTLRPMHILFGNMEA